MDAYTKANKKTAEKPAAKEAPAKKNTRAAKATTTKSKAKKWLEARVDSSDR